MRLDKYDLLSKGIYVDHITPVHNLTNLVNSLWPVKTKIPLIRVGSNNDGGYLIPDDLVGITTCFSPGVDINASFEQDLLIRYHIKSHLADYSVNGPPPGFMPKSFTKKYLGALDDETFVTLDKWVLDKTSLDPTEDLLLQMDIEGGEYATLLRASEETLKKFRIIVIEIHNIEAWGQINFFNLVNTFFHKLLRNFNVVHNHPNNCCGIVNIGGFLAPRVFELTLLRKDRASSDGFIKIFPHILDRPNLNGKEDLILPKNWFFKAG